MGEAQDGHRAADRGGQVGVGQLVEGDIANAIVRRVNEHTGRDVDAGAIDRGHAGDRIQRRQRAFDRDFVGARTEHGQREGVDRGDGFGLVLGHKQDASGQSY